jgi:serine/threonine protein kinase|eukprot:TRINITY_DN181_c2_g2_i1.p2 TRINITY_DN181_c2_g2~~TRINITY_DN181_c2_g2_i1.p2  ORF type:complete len:481 (+),score=262.16 TRINITY_DN181_c2_g2_i1:129-1571(+)
MSAVAPEDCAQVRETPNKLIVKVLAARELAGKDFGGSSDPFATVTLDEQQCRTRTVRKTLAPEWGEEFAFDVTRESTSPTSMSMLEVQVWSHNQVFANDFLGVVQVPIHSIEPGRSYEKWHVLAPRKAKDKVSGSVQLEIMRTDSEGTLSTRDFQLLATIGQGSYGKVLQVKKKDNGQIYALKIIKKETLIRRQKIKHTKSEKSILIAANDHPFLVGLKYSFQSEDKLYLVLDYISGGELFYHLQKARRFEEDRAKFYAAEILIALEFLHQNGVIYRDLKPENVLLDMDGHVVLTDFGLCKEGIGYDERTQTFCGTPEYMAPEMLAKTPYGFPVDWWSFGTLLYEMIAGLPPFYSKNGPLMIKQIMEAEIKFPAHFSEDARSICTALLSRDPAQRLGSRGGADEVKTHPFFASLDWEAMYRKGIDPPFKPKMRSETDLVNFDPRFTEMTPTDESPGPQDKKIPEEMQRMFDGFDYAHKGK